MLHLIKIHIIILATGSGTGFATGAAPLFGSVGAAPLLGGVGVSPLLGGSDIAPVGGLAFQGFNRMHF